MLTTPVLVIAYNRARLLPQVLEPVLGARPQTLLLAADGPAPERKDDVERCAEVRALLDAVEISGTVHRDYAPGNLGAGRRVASAIDWALRLHDEVIVIEDDLVAEASFFPYCEEVLARYREDERVGMVSGGNYQFGRSTGPYSYYFSAGVGTWGWATWRRAWRHFDFAIRGWPAGRARLQEVWKRPEIVRYWEEKLELVSGGVRRDIWDYQWAFTLWQHGFLQVVPRENLISCIGFTPDATHLTSGGVFADMPVGSLAFPLQHPPEVVRDVAADLWEFHKIFMPLSEEALESP